MNRVYTIFHNIFTVVGFIPIGMNAGKMEILKKSWKKAKDLISRAMWVPCFIFFKVLICYFCLTQLLMGRRLLLEDAWLTMATSTPRRR